MRKKREALAALEKFLRVVEKLGGPGGCPWDRTQTMKSIRPCLVEEVCETLEAIDHNDTSKLKNELGDLLYLIFFYVRLADRKGAFTLKDVVRSISGKLVRRHPAVFGDATAHSEDDASHLWHKRKKSEKEHRHRNSALDGIPHCLPALQKAHKVQHKAASVGFDWPTIDDLLPKLTEETDEFIRALRHHDRNGIEEELGDLLFTMVNVSRRLSLDPERLLHNAVAKFERRFRDMEKQLSKNGRRVGKASLMEMDVGWETV
jgi:MazG family protein